MQKGMGTMQEGESDELKRVLLEGNPYFLVLTGRSLHPTIYILHPRPQTPDPT